MKLGSLFDGSGTCPLAASLVGIEPVWAAEVEPFPIAVTKSKFLNMEHLGDISNINGAEIEPVDVVTFGSPCQDLSIAGKRAGLKHAENGDEETTRSGLFMEAIRIVKEMREKTDGRCPTFALWENVPGAFSSNKGEDFKIVLEEFIKVAEPEAPSLPPISKNGWAYADVYMGDGWSIAYRVLDAQFWGTPQRRRRIFLVADFRGQRAGKILFEREGMRGHFAQSGTPWQGITGDAENCAGGADQERICLICMATQQGGAEITQNGICPTITAAAGMSGNNQPVICYSKTYDARGNGDGNVVPTLTGDHESRVTDYTALVTEPVFCLQGNGIDRADTAGCNGKGWKEDVCYTLNTIDRPAVAFAMQAFGKYTESEVASAMKSRDYKDATDLVVEGSLTKWDNQARRVYSEDGVFPALAAREKSGQNQQAVLTQHIVRRLTPTECARLQGFPNDWGNIQPKDDFTDEEYQFWKNVRNTHAEINGKNVRDYSKSQMLSWYNKLHTDSAEYKMWGNGMALPCVLYIMEGIREALARK